MLAKLLRAISLHSKGFKGLSARIGMPSDVLWQLDGDLHGLRISAFPHKMKRVEHVKTLHAQFAFHRDAERELGLFHFSSSNLATASVCTSSGPSARRRVRTLAQAAARNVSWATPAPPCAWMARSSTRKVTLGATTLIMAISARAILLPTVSIM